MASGDDARGLSLDDVALSAALLPGFLDDLNELSETDLLCSSPVDASSGSPSFVSYQTSSETSPRPIFGQFSVISSSSSTSNPTPKDPATHEAVAKQHLAPSAAQNYGEMASRSPKTALKDAKTGVHKLPMQNSTRIRQKEELGYLRNKVQALEQELEAKRRELTAASTDNKENRPLTRAQRGHWQRIAKRQLVEKQRAEMQNLQLRGSLVDQLKLARSLQKLLKRRKDEGTEAAQLQARLEFSHYCSGDGEDALYETLLRDMDTVYAEVDTVCARHHVMQRLEEGSEVSSLQGGETEALSLEATNSKIVPFGMEETCSAVWRCLSREHIKLADGTYHGVASSPDTIRAKAMTTLRVDTTQARMQMRFAMKKFVERGRVVITCESASESEGPKDLLHGLKMMQRAWVVIRPVPIEEDELIDGDEPPEETIIQLCMRLTPSLSAGVLGTPGPRTGAVTELLLAAVHRNLSWLFQTVENILMEHDFGTAPLHWCLWKFAMNLPAEKWVYEVLQISFGGVL
ncbi:hypothetical protein PF008_g7847 [Phytophthora fragariae]|uniref:Uncharacterized protein n=2 Tax=Phytophthora fragariae TaxID=53985 RepID=A0A6G0S1B6_9STRA|nr:hypothetical protein PF008_g7847 [Phytophthora fragariae]